MTPIFEYLIIREAAQLRIKRYGLIGVGMTIEGNVSLKMDFKISDAQARPSGSVSFLLPADSKAEHLGTKYASKRPCFLP